MIAPNPEPEPRPPTPPGDDRAPAGYLEGSPWLTIWTRPRATVRTVVDTDPHRDVFLLAGIWGFGSVLVQTLGGKAAEELSVGASVGMAAVGGPMFGIVALYVNAALVGMTARWLGGRAPAEHLRAAVAWGSLPNVFAQALMAGSLLAFGPDFLKLKEGAPVDPRLLAVIGVGTSLNVWGFILTIKGVGEVERWSSLQAFASMLLAFLLIVPILLAMLVLAVASGVNPGG